MSDVDGVQGAASPGGGSGKGVAKHARGAGEWQVAGMGRGPMAAGVIGLVVIVALVVVWAVGGFSGGSSGSAPAPATAGHAYVTEIGGPGLVPVALSNGALGKPLDVVAQPLAVAGSPTGPTLYVVDGAQRTLVVVNVATGKASLGVPIGGAPLAVAVTPDGSLAYVVNEANGTVVPVDVATLKAATPVPVGKEPTALAVAPDGRMVYVANDVSDTVTPVAVRGQSAGSPIGVGVAPDTLAVTPDSRTLYVGNENSGSLTPIQLSGSSGRALPEIRLGMAPTAVAAVSDSTVYVGGVETRGHAGSKLEAVVNGRLDTSGSGLVLPGEPVAMTPGPGGTLLIAGIAPPAAAGATAGAKAGSSGAKAKKGHATTTTTSTATVARQPRGYVAEVSLNPPAIEWRQTLPDEVTSVAVPGG